MKQKVQDQQLQQKNTIEQDHKLVTKTGLINRFNKRAGEDVLVLLM